MSEAARAAGRGGTSAQSAGPRIAAVVVLVLALSMTAWQAWRAKTACQGEFTYASDAAYQHLIVAEVVAAERAYGDLPEDERYVDAGLSASESPLWTWLLVGVVRLIESSGSVADSYDLRFVLAPLVINLVLVGLLVAVAGHLFRDDIHRFGAMFGCLLAVVIVIAAPTLALAGTPVLAHAVVLLLATCAVLEFVESQRVSLGAVVVASVLAALAVGLSYVSLSVMLATVLWGWRRERFARLILPGVAVLAVLVYFGWRLTEDGYWFVPDAVIVSLLGATTGGWQEWLIQSPWRLIDGLVNGGLLTALIFVAAATLWVQGVHAGSALPYRRVRAAWLFVFLVASLIHLAGLGTSAGSHDLEHGGALRTDAYLRLLGLVAIVRALAIERGPMARQIKDPNTGAGLGRRPGALMAMACILPLLIVAWPQMRAIYRGPEACAAVYHGERLMASFADVYFRDAPVAVNRAGSIQWKRHRQTVDLSGVFDHGVAVARWRGEFDRDFVARTLNGPDANIVLLAGRGQDCTDRTALPVADWIDVGGWTGIQSSAPSDGVGRAAWHQAHVRILALEPSAAASARAALEVFEGADIRPAGVKVGTALIEEQRLETRPATQEVSSKAQVKENRPSMP